jgi:hypothetical protein
MKVFRRKAGEVAQFSTPGHQSDVGGELHFPANIPPFLISISGTISHT